MEGTGVGVVNHLNMHCDDIQHHSVNNPIFITQIDAVTFTTNI